MTLQHLLVRFGILVVTCLLPLYTAAEPAASKAEPTWGATAGVLGFASVPVLVPHPRVEPAVGLGFLAGLGHRALPLYIGLDFGGLTGISRKRNVSVALDGRATQVLETRTRRAARVNAWLRMQPTKGALRPFVELSGGVLMLDYEYRLSLPASETTTSTIARQRITPSAGVGTGLEIRLGEALNSPEAAFFLIVGVRQLWGGRVDEHHAHGSVELHTRATLFNVGLTAHAPFAPSSAAR